MTVRRQVRALVAAVAVLGGVNALAIAMTPVELVPDFLSVRTDPAGNHFDFPIFWAAWRMVVAGATPYDPTSYAAVLGVAGWLEYMAPAPWALVWVAPFGVLGASEAFLAWRTTSFVLLVASVFLAWPLFSRSRIGRGSLLAALVFAPAFFAIYVGQLALVLALSVIVALRLYRADAPLLAGASLSVVLVKPQLVYLVLFLIGIRTLTDRRVRAVAVGMVLGLAAQMVIGSLARPGLIVEWLSWVTSDAPPSYLVTPTIPAVIRLVVYLTTGAVTSIPWVVVPALTLVAATVWSVRHRDASFEGVILMALPLSLLTTPHAMLYDQSLLLVCHVLMLAAYANHRRPRQTVGVLAVQLVYVALLAVGPQELFWHLWYPAFVALWLARAMAPSRRQD